MVTDNAVLYIQIYIKVVSGVISRMHSPKADYIHTKCDAAYLIDVCHPVVVLAVVVIFQW